MNRQIDCLGLGIMPLDLLFEVAHFPAPESKIDGCGMTVQGGGPVPNVLVGLSRLGHSAALISAVADDYSGQLGRAELAKDSIDTRFLVTKRGTSDTAAGFIEKGTGRRTLVLNRLIHVRPRDITLDRYPIPRLIHLDGRDLDACLKLARWGRKVGASICFDIGSMRNDISPIFPLVDHLVVADSYAMPFTKTKTAEAAIKKLRQHCAGTIVVTEGIRGALGCENNIYVRRPAFRVRVADTTGAGDAFHTGYLYGLLHNMNLGERLIFGAATAALKCTKMGARTGLPRVAAVRRFMRGRPKTYA